MSCLHSKEFIPEISALNQTPVKEFPQYATLNDPGVTSIAQPRKPAEPNSPILPTWTETFPWTPVKTGCGCSLSALLHQWKQICCILERELSETGSTLWTPSLVRCPWKQRGVILLHACTLTHQHQVGFCLNIWDVCRGFLRFGTDQRWKSTEAPDTKQLFSFFFLTRWGSRSLLSVYHLWLFLKPKFLPLFFLSSPLTFTVNLFKWCHS